jgi:uncharacterized protein with ATP-grasp and redox domains
MSVIFFDIAKIEQLYSLLEFHLVKVKPIIQYNPYYDQFARKAEHSAGVLHLPFEEEKCTIQFIRNILYYAVISNWVAYGVQYNVEIDFKELSKINFDQCIPKADTLKNLIKELDHLRYNMNTNSGNFFIDAKWLNPFEEVINMLAQSVLKD